MQNNNTTLYIILQNFTQLSSNNLTSWHNYTTLYNTLHKFCCFLHVLYTNTNTFVFKYYFLNKHFTQLYTTLHTFTKKNLHNFTQLYKTTIHNLSKLYGTLHNSTNTYTNLHNNKQLQQCTQLYTVQQHTQVYKGLHNFYKTFYNNMHSCSTLLQNSSPFFKALYDVLHNTCFTILYTLYKTLKTLQTSQCIAHFLQHNITQLFF